MDLKGSDYNWSYQTPPSSPSSIGSRKSSLCRYLTFFVNYSNKMHISPFPVALTFVFHTLSAFIWRATLNCFLCLTGSLVHLPPGGAHRLSSVSSHDSGFVSQDANAHSKPPSPMPSDIASQVKSQFVKIRVVFCGLFCFLLTSFELSLLNRSPPVLHPLRLRKPVSQSASVALPR